MIEAFLKGESNLYDILAWMQRLLYKPVTKMV